MRSTVQTDFRLENIEISSVLPLCGDTRKKPAHSTPSKHSHSEDDWAWVCARLARDMDAAKLTRELASRRADKSDPLYYAQRTVDVASARLWLDQGIPIDDIITMLEVRRRFEIPAAVSKVSCAGDCGHGSAHDCPSQDGLNPQPKGDQYATT